MTNNRKIANSVFTELRKNNLIPTDIQFGNSYFLWSMEDDGVVHFHIKGIRGWKFAMWIDDKSKENVIEFFTQYEDDIDKFKPSRSLFVTNITRSELKYITQGKSKPEWVYFDIIRLVKHIKSNPALAYVQNYMDSFYITDPLWKCYASCKTSAYKNKIYKLVNYAKEDVLAGFINKVSASIVNHWNEDVLDKIVVVDQNTKNYTMRPRWDVQFYYNRISKDDLEQGTAMAELTDKINKYHFLFTTTNTCYTDLVPTDNPDGRNGYCRWERW